MEDSNNFGFEQSVTFFKNHANSRYVKPIKAEKDKDKMQKLFGDGTVARNNFINFANTITSNFTDLEYTDCSMWQGNKGRGHNAIKSYFWIQLKNPKWKDRIQSISLSFGADNSLDVRVDIHQENKRLKDDSKFRYDVFKQQTHLIDLPLQKGFEFRTILGEDYAEYSVDEVDLLREKLKNDEYLPLVQVGTSINSLAERDKAGTLLKDTINAVSTIKSYYDHVMMLADNSNEQQSKNKYWLYSPGENASNWDELYDAGIMGIGWDLIGDLRKYDSQDDIDNALQKTDDSNASQKINAKALWQFANDMKPGDVVFAKKGTGLIIGKGIVKSDYLFDDDRTELKHVRKIDWTNKGEWKNSGSAIRKTLTEISAKEAEKLSELLNDSTYKDSNHNYWWLNAKPKEWSFSDIEAGTSQSYSFYNEKGNKRRIFQNYQNANVGDLVIGYETTPVLKVVALAKVSAKTTESISFEIVEHLENPIDYKVLKNAPELSGMEFFANPNGSLFKLSKDEYDYITNVIWEERPPVKEQSAFGSYTKTDFLRDVYISDKQYEELCSVLKYKKNIILQGPPGVGKTWMAKRLSWSCMGKMQDDHIKMIQFHQNYSYEDFVCGYKPDDEGFALKTGVFYDFCKRAKSNKGEKFFFIIDEINRGNMSKIFGELLMLIENEYRNEAIQLPYSELPPFEVPDNVYIIGMMNTADRSLAMIDYALRRRFSFFDIEPCFTKHKDKKENEEQENRFWEYIEGLKKDTLMRLIETIIDLNTEITEDLGKGFCIGHSYFCNLDNLKEGITIEERLKEIVKYEIIPMLREYWFDNSDKVGTWENRLLGVISKNEG